MTTTTKRKATKSKVPAWVKRLPVETLPSGVNLDGSPFPFRFLPLRSYLLASGFIGSQGIRYQVDDDRKIRRIREGQDEEDGEVIGVLPDNLHAIWIDTDCIGEARRCPFDPNNWYIGTREDVAELHRLEDEKMKRHLAILDFMSGRTAAQ